MARARNIKPGFFKNEYLASCEYGARLVFAGLWTLADREGRMEDRPLRIKAEIMPFDSCDIEDFLNQLVKYQFITRYEIDGCKYIQVNNFKKHQNPHVKEPASTIPAWCAHQSGPADSLLLIPDSPLPIPPNPQGGCSVRKRRRSKPKELAVYDPDAVPPTLRCPSFLATWQDFFRHRQELRKPMTPTAAKAALGRCAELGVEGAIIALREAMANGWQGFGFQTKGNRNGQPRINPGNTHDPGAAERDPDHGRM